MQRLTIGQVEHFTDIDGTFPADLHPPPLVHRQVCGRSDQETGRIIDALPGAVLGQPDEGGM